MSFKFYSITIILNFFWWKLYKTNKKTIDEKNIDNKILYFYELIMKPYTTPRQATIAPLEKGKEKWNRNEKDIINELS